MKFAADDAQHLLWSGSVNWSSSAGVPLSRISINGTLVSGPASWDRDKVIHDAIQMFDDHDDPVEAVIALVDHLHDTFVPRQEF